MPEFDVHYQLNGYMTVDAGSPEEARKKANDYINSQLPILEFSLASGFADDDYTTDVINNESGEVTHNEE